MTHGRDNPAASAPESTGAPPWRRLVRPLDWAIIVVAGAVAIGSARFGAAPHDRDAGSGARYVSVEIGGNEVARWVPPESVARRDTIAGPLGPLVIETLPGAVRMVAAPCPHRECVRQGAVGPGGRPIVCAPSRAVVRFAGRAADHTVDAVTQ